MRFRRATALVVGLTSLGATAPANAAGPSPKHDRVERSVIKKLNAIRTQHGVRKLRSSRGLARAADAKSAAIATTGDFSHGDVRSRVNRYVRASLIGETLAWVPVAQGRRADSVVNAWMASPSHSATLLSASFRRVGVARRRATIGGAPAVVFTVDLAAAR